MTNYIKKIKSFDRIDIINYLILLYAFVLTFPSEIKRVAAILLIILWITDNTKYNFKLPKTNLFKAFGFFVAFSLISYFWSDVSIKEALLYIKRYWYYFPAFIIFKYLKEDFLKYALSFFLFGMLISEILSYGNFFALWKIGFGNPHDPTVFMQHSLYGIYLTVTAYILLSILFQVNNNKDRIIYSLFFITVTINLLINSGRTGYFTFFLGSIIIIFFIIEFKIKNIIFFVLAFSTILSTIYLSSPNFKNRINQIGSDIVKMKENYNFNSSVGARVGFWIIAKETIKESPIIGVGINNHINYKNQLIDNMILENNQKFKLIKSLEHYHNYHLTVLTQYGLLGYLLFLYTLYSILILNIKNKIINVLKISVIVIFFIGSFADMLFYLNKTMSLFAFCIGLVLAQYKFEKIK